MAPRIPLPRQPAGAEWPTREWPGHQAGSAPRNVAASVAESLFSTGNLERFGTTDALLMVQRGELVFERYATGTDLDSTLRSWSTAKSITDAVAGLIVSDGRFKVVDVAPVPEWWGADDPRRRITIDQLLRMTDGLDLQEDWVEAELCRLIASADLLETS